MAKDNFVLRQAAWRELFPWLLIVRSFRVALDPRKVLLAAGGLFAAWLGCYLISLLFSGNASVALVSQPLVDFPWEGVRDGAGLDGQRLPENLSDRLSRPFVGLFSINLGFAQGVFLLLCGLWTLAVWSVVGGMISRMAAMEFALEESISLGEAFRHARKFAGTYFCAPLYPLIGVALALLPMALLGLLTRFDAGLFAAALLWPLALAAGLLIGVLAVGLLVSWPLMWPTTAVEGSDSFEPLSRAYGYVFQRPVRYFCYVLLAAVVGSIAYGLIAWFASFTASFTLYGVSWGAGGERIGDVVQALPSEQTRDMATVLGSHVGAGDKLDSGLGYAAVQVLNFWFGLVGLTALGYGFSYFWTASVSIYFLLRQDVDGAELDEIFREEADEPFGLPPLPPAPVPSPKPEEQPPAPTSETPAPSVAPMEKPAESPSSPEQPPAGDGSTST